MAHDRSDGPGSDIEAELREMRESLRERRRRLLHRKDEALNRPPPPSSEATPRTEVRPPEARWLAAAHQAWKSQVAELLRDRKEAERAQRQLQAELDSAHRAWKSQVAELLERVSAAEAKTVERDRWLMAAHQAWKSQVAELLARVAQAEARPADSDSESSAERTQAQVALPQDQLRHVEELERVHAVYQRRSQQVESHHKQVVEALRLDNAQIRRQLTDALRLIDRLNESLQQNELASSETRASPSRKRRFLDRTDEVPTIVGPGPDRPKP